MKGASSGKLLAVQALEIATTSLEESTETSDAMVEKWFNLVTELAQSQESQVLLGGRNLLDAIPRSVPTNLFVDKLIQIWGGSVAESAPATRSTRISRLVNFLSFLTWLPRDT